MTRSARGTKLGPQKILLLSIACKSLEASNHNMPTRTIRNLLLSPKISQRVVNFLLAIFIGAIGGLGAIAFRFLIKFFQNIFYQNPNDFLTFCHTVPFYLKILIPALGGAIAGPIIYFFAKEAKGHGVPEVMEALVLKGGRIRARLTFLKMLVSAICIGSGSSVGREGPIVMIGSSAGSMVGQFLKASQKRLILLCQIRKAESSAPCIESQDLVIVKTSHTAFKASFRKEVVHVFLLQMKTGLCCFLKHECE